ncbi:tripartite tricarboxylate transporter substrate-binding protein [Variovorax sp. J22P168]|uniref:Bug family tripartite tricarboxylate transporter substrate binding protein n=1 Tax=Variovorax jilinensis TaxID=3053513 RepID=UPI0025752560|nr:tripartite tricarboxylate transporter substrate-binding protein [Variovorax sp. J22P168]MDM0015606.1 tripartite tricarboxylate transporter substrate-binding protein [Variovorax sp. J22P168]
MPKRRDALRALPLVLLPGLGVATRVRAAAGDDPSNAAAECVIPAKAGGGFDLTCALARDSLQVVRPGRPPLAQSFLPGGIGAVAFDRIATGRLGGPEVLVAFSSGSLLNIAQGRFGPHSASAARWIAALGTDYGVVAVHRDSPFRSLADIMAALRREPSRVVFGAGGTVGSQDWVKAALLLRAAGRDPKSMRFVSFEGGGDALNALQGKHVDVFPGDAAEALQAIAAGAAVRILAVLSESALGGGLTGIPTARSQQVDLVWPTVRGVYMSAEVAEPALRAWVDAFREAMAAPGFPALRERHRLYPFSLTGAALEAYVATSLAQYAKLATELGLRRWSR